MKKIFVITGASGLVGTNLIYSLLKTNNDFSIIAIENRCKIDIEDKKLLIKKGNINDIDSLDDIFNIKEKCEKICIHAAGYITTKLNDYDEAYKINVLGTRNVIDMCKKYNFKKLIYVSSTDVFSGKSGDIIDESYSINKKDLYSPYAISKAIATNEVLAVKGTLKTICVFPTAIIGPNDKHYGNFSTLIKSYLNDGFPAIIDGGYDLVDVRDVVEAIIKISYLSKCSNKYILSNKYFTLKELMNLLSQLTKKKEINKTIPYFIIKPLMPLANLYYKLTKQKPLFTSYSLKVVRRNIKFSHEKSTRELEYRPRSIANTIESTIKWINEN
ncbi:MAG: NAD-dependent epimerase/dehydratase family protein [Bacilli bacterium]